MLIYHEEEDSAEFTTHANSLQAVTETEHCYYQVCKDFQGASDKDWIIKQVITCVMEVSGCGLMLALREKPYFSK